MSGTALAIAITPIITPHVAAAVPNLPAQEDINLWLDSAVTIFQDTGGTIPATTTGDRIALWRDRSDYLWDFIINLSDDAPVLETSFGGIRSLYFGLDPDVSLYPAWLQCEDFAVFGLEYWSFACVIIPGSVAAYTRRFVNDGPSDKRIQINTAEQLEVLNDQTVPAEAVTLQSTTILTTNQPTIITGRFGTGNTPAYALRLNNSQEDTATGNTPTTLWNGASVGMSTNPANVYIAELIIWQADLTDAELTQAYQYLANKHGL